MATFPPAYQPLKVKSGPADIDYARTCSGTVTIAATTALTGGTVGAAATKFLSELLPGQTVVVGGVERIIDTITDDHTAAVTVAFTATISTGVAFDAYYNLGLTKDGFKWTVNNKSFEVDTDQLDVVNEYLIGRKLGITMNLAQWDTQNVSIAFPGDLPYIPGASSTAPGLARITPSIGSDSLALSHRLKIIPRSGANGTRTTDVGEIVSFWLVGPSWGEAQTIEYKKGAQRVLTANLRVWPDSTHRNMFGFVGDFSLDA